MMYYVTGPGCPENSGDSLQSNQTHDILEAVMNGTLVDSRFTSKDIEAKAVISSLSYRFLVIVFMPG